jgi:hypothetical protein
MERKARFEKATKRRRVHRAAPRRAVRKVVDLGFKNYVLESHPELGV